MRFSNFPNFALATILALMIYANFFTHHYIPDLRWLLIMLTIVFFGKTMIRFTPIDRAYKMPLVIAAGLASLFLYLAENIGTLTATWTYAGTQGLSLTDPAKNTSWYLLLYLSFMQVIWLHRESALDRSE